MTATLSAVGHLGEDFLAQVYGRTYQMIPGAADRFAGLLSWDDLNDILTRHRLEAPRLRLAMDGATLPQYDYTTPQVTRRNVVWHRLRPAALHQHLAAGATLVLDAVDELHPAVERVAGELERYFRTRVQVNGYASFTGTEGFGVHWDDHDVVVIQLDGAKRWRIYGPTRTAPMHRDVAAPEPPPEEPETELVLTAGDMLYLPRGWWHAVAASEGTHSLHLTCGLQTTTGADVLVWLSETLREHDTVRADVPRFGTAQEKRSFTEALHKLLTAELRSDDLIDRYAAARDATDTGRLRPSLPHVTDIPPKPDLIASLVTARADLSDDEHGNAVLTAGGERWTFATPAHPLLALLTDGAPHSLKDLAEAADLSVRQVTSVVGQLVDGEVATVGEAR